MSDTTKLNQYEKAAGDDASQFFKRIELFNAFQNYPNDICLNLITPGINVIIGKRFTTCLDVPFMCNSLPSTADCNHFGFGDISTRLLGYQLENPLRLTI